MNSTPRSPRHTPNANSPSDVGEGLSLEQCDEQPARRSRRRRRVTLPLSRLALLVSLLLVGVMAGCDDESTEIPEFGRATLQFQLVTEFEPGADQTGFADLEHVWITWDEIRLDRAGSADIVLTVTEDFDLLEHVDAPKDLFGPTTIPAGSYRALTWSETQHEIIGTGQGEACVIIPVGIEVVDEHVIRDAAGNPDTLIAEDGGSYTLLIDTVTTRLDCQVGWQRDPDATEVRKVN